MGSVQRLTLLLVAGVAVSLGTASPCRAAGLVIEAPTLTGVAPGSSGSFDVLLIDTDPTGTAGYNVSGNSLELTLSGPAGFTFTDATVNTSVHYIYVQSTDVNLGVPFSANTFPNTDFVGGDAEFASPFFRMVNPGDIFGLAHVSYTVPHRVRHGNDHDPEPECRHVFVGHQRHPDPVHGGERLDLDDPRARDMDSGRNRRLDRPGRILAVPEHVNG